MAVEAALVLPVYVAFTVFLFQLALLFFWQQVLDSSLTLAARNIQTGQAQGNPQITDSASFMAAYLCPVLSGLLDCGRVSVNVQTVDDYYSNASFTVPRKPNGAINQTAMTYCSGAPSKLMIVRAVYMAPISFWPIFPTSASGTPIVSAAAFQDEAFPQAGGGGC